jgi:tripartite ATP-independent transporter DctP family solute receptor
MKKQWCILVVLALIGGLVWAGGGKQSSGAAGAGPTKEKPLVLRFSNSDPEDSIMVLVSKVFKEEVEKRSNGAIKVDIYYNAQLAEATQNIPMIVRGAFEMSPSGATYIQEFMPELGVLNMGYLYKNFDHANAYLNGNSGRQLFKRIGEQTGVLPLGAYYYGARNVCITKDRAIRTPSDLVDIKMRTNGTDPMMFLAKAMGSNPVGIPLGEMYTALQTGTVDGQENPINGVITYKLYEVSKSLTFTRHFIDCTWITIGNKIFNSLSPEYQKMIQDCATYACEVQSKASLEAEAKTAGFLRERGLKLYDVDVTPIRNQVLAAYQEKAKQDKWDMAVFEEIQKAGEKF